MEVTGTLKNYTRSEHTFTKEVDGKTHFIIYSGYLYDDAKGRFADGTYISTSYVVEESDTEITTRNSRYLLA